MDEELININPQDVTEVVIEEYIDEVSIEEDSATEIATEEQIYDINLESEDTIVVDISESMGWISGDNRYHNSLLGIDYPNQHPIGAITGLREELNEIERLKTVYSDKFNVANYYKWQDASYDESGYFVSFVPNTSTIQICNGTDIFGVSVDGAGFIGGQNASSPRAESYGLIATSGLVDVRCELDVQIGDYVVSNAHGYATKSDSNYGYKVLDKETKHGVEYAIIMLGVQADVTNALGAELDEIEKRVGTNESNIVSAINVANQSYNKANEIGISNQAMSDKVDNALGVVDKVVSDVDNLETQVSNSAIISAQAKAIAEGAVTSATTLRNEAISRANDAWAKADNVETEVYSLCAKIDKYSVGEYSQAYGLTLDQAQNILEPGMIYAPTKHVGATEYHTEAYEYTNNAEEWVETSRDESKVYYDAISKKYWYYSGGWKPSDDMPKYTRIFTPEYLYQWGYLPAIQKYGWITIDKKHNPTNYASMVETNEASKAVYFFFKEPNVVVGEDFGYWYTDCEEIEDKYGKIGTYEPYTLYKWETDHWVAVATLKGNVSNRMASEIYQTTNEIMMGVINPRGCIAVLDARVTDTESLVTSTSQWTKGSDENGNCLLYNLATIEQKADDGGSSIVLAVADMDGNKPLNGASITLNQDDGGSSVYIDASHIVLDGKTSFTSDDNGETRIHGGYIATDTITADKIKVDSLAAISADLGTLTAGTIDANKVTVKNLDASSINVDGDLNAFGATIGGWEVTDNEIKSTSGNVALYSGDSYHLSSDISDAPIRYYAGPRSSDIEHVSVSTSADQNGFFELSIQTQSRKIYSVSAQADYNRSLTASQYQTVTNGVLHIASMTFNYDDLRANERIVNARAQYYTNGTLVGCNIGFSDRSIQFLEIQNIRDENSTLLNQDHFEVQIIIDVLCERDYISNLAYAVSNTNKLTVSGNIREPNVRPKVYLQIIYTGYDFAICDDGTLYASNAYIEGNITATSGRIGGFSLEDGNLTSGYEALTEDIVTGSNNSVVSTLRYVPYRSGYAVASKVDGSNGGYTETEIIIPDEYEGKPVLKIDDGAFYDCNNLTSVTIGNNITSIGKQAFCSCDNLTSVTIPDSVDDIQELAFKASGIQNIYFGLHSRLQVIGNYAFEGCAKLTKIELHDVVRVINNGAFRDCTSLQQIILGTNIAPGTVKLSDTSSVTYGYGIHTKAFYGCPEDLKICYKGTIDDWNNNELGDPTSYIRLGSTITFTSDNFYYYDENGTHGGNYWKHNRPSGICISGTDKLISTKYFTLDADGIITAENANIKGEISAETISAKKIMVMDENKRTHLGITANIQYYKDLAVSHDGNGVPVLSYSLGELKFVNGILVDVT